MWLHLYVSRATVIGSLDWAKGLTRWLTLIADKLVLVVACRGLRSCPDGFFHKAA